MGLPGNPSPREFGEALRTRREASGVSLEEIVERTKISRRTLEAFESGEFGYLPSGTFPRLFLKQYLEIVGEEPGPWLTALARALERHSSDSQPHVEIGQIPARSRRVGPWLIGLGLVGVALVGVVLVERQQDGESARLPTPTPEILLSSGPPIPPTTTPAEPRPTPEPDPNTVVVSSGPRSCWVQVRVTGEQPQSRLLAAGTVWEVAAGGRPVDLVLGDGGSVEIDYLGRRMVAPGRPGEVVRLHLASTGEEATPTAAP